MQQFKAALAGFSAALGVAALFVGGYALATPATDDVDEPTPAVQVIHTDAACEESCDPMFSHTVGVDALGAMTT